MRLVHIWSAVGGRLRSRLIEMCECGALRWRVGGFWLYSTGLLNGRLTGAWEEAVPPCTRNVPRAAR